MELFFTAGDVARRLELTPAAIRAMERRGELAAAARTERGTRLFTAAAINDLLQRRGRSKAGGRDADAR